MVASPLPSPGPKRGPIVRKHSQGSPKKGDKHGMSLGNAKKAPEGGP